MTRPRTLLLIGLFALWPSVASAQFGWWEFLEGLSGPGPYDGYAVGLRLACTTNDGSRDARYAVRWPCPTDHDPDIRQLVDVRVARLSSGEGERPRFKDAPGDRREVTAFRLESIASVRIHPMLDVGAGGGLIRFAGAGFSPIWRPTLTPVSAMFTPFAIGVSRGAPGSRLKRLVKIRLDETYFPKGFTGADFGNAATSYSTDGEWIFSSGIVIDFGVFLFR